MKTFVIACLTVVLYPLLSFQSFSLEVDRVQVCRQAFDERKNLNIDAKNADKLLHIQPLHESDTPGIKKGLNIRRNTGVAPIKIQQAPMSIETAHRLRQMLIDTGSILMVDKHHASRIYEIYWRHNRTEIKFPKIEAENILEQTNIIEYIISIERVLSEVEARKVSLQFVYTRTETETSPAQHRHDPYIGDPFTMTHAIIGAGTWFEAIHKNQHGIALAKEGETLILSEPSRNENLFPELSNIGALHGAPNNLGKRLILIASFQYAN